MLDDLDADKVKSDDEDILLPITQVVLRKRLPRRRNIQEMDLANVHVAQEDCQACRAAMQSGEKTCAGRDVSSDTRLGLHGVNSAYPTAGRDNPQNAEA
jgi:hypothetical protein